MARIFLGTSGWSYDHWSGHFYPKGLPARERLAFYATRFGSVEVNNSFYTLPSETTLNRWGRTVPEEFIFSVKASRFITHMKKLRDPADSLYRFSRRTRALGARLGPVLFQLPPGWGFDSERLTDFLETLDRLHPDRRYVFEFRDRDWLNDECYGLLHDHGVALCLYDMAGYRSPRRITADFTYVRLHGPGQAYQGSYDGRTLRGWADVMQRWLGDGVDVYCYFDNDEAAHAPKDAMRLAGMLGLDQPRSGQR